MENFTKNSLKAAVAKYGQLLESASEAVLIEELKKDERAFTDEQIAEIVLAVKVPVIEEEEPQSKDHEQDHEQIPEWAANALVEIFEPLFKSLSDEISDLKKALVKANKESTPNAVASVEDDFDDDSDYVVASGKSFRDSNDFSKEYTEGDDVSHLDKEVKKRLFANGLIEEA